MWGVICVFCETGLRCTYEVRLRAALADGMVEVCQVQNVMIQRLVKGC